MPNPAPADWLVEPLDEYANKFFSREINEENASRNVLCTDNEVRNLWLCQNYQQVAKFLRSKRTDDRLCFKVWRRRGGSQPEPWPPKSRASTTATALAKKKPRHRHTVP